MDILAAALVAAIALAIVLLMLGPLAGFRARRTSTGGEGNGKSRHGKTATTSPGRKAPPSPAQARRCPLCATELGPGERVKSDLSAGTGDRIMRIFGCPHCWPAIPDRPPRLCPVCGQEIPADGHAIARYFERPGRKHVHVLGCSLCRPAL